ncbi:MAG: Sporulation-specific protease YabG [Firmicutes bacterium]|nr:Sporulation-specific protease YabG [Bacillota bacterium]MDI6705127.1 sporulation peptidase YabG [Bacillota bacterium]
MSEFRIGDLVARKSYDFDVLFKIVEIIDHSGKERVYILKGVHMRVLADAPGNDLVRQTAKEVKRFTANNDNRVNKNIDYVINARKIRNSAKGIKGAFFHRTKNSFSRAGKVLHLDGDKDYLDTCLEKYEEMELKATGVHVPESQQPAAVGGLLKEHIPDIVVLTGHDALVKGYKDINDINYYRNSRYYAAAVKEARKFEPSYDDLVIFAGACQSHFEAILEAGANYASSPNRVLIHALDPVFVCEKIAFSGVDNIVSTEDLISRTITGVEGIGGLQTRGKYREGLPKSPYLKG